jgi:outer membrane receptor for ferric coprogen and ferric-rhodotorulic acid
MRSEANRVLVSAVAMTVAAILSQALRAQATSHEPAAIPKGQGDTLPGAPESAAPSVYFDLPAQNLADALRAVGRRADVNVLINQDLVGDRQAPALRALLTVGEALERLLRGTGLVPQFVDDKTVVLATAASRAKNDSSTSDSLSSASASSGKQALQAAPMLRLARASEDATESGADGSTASRQIEDLEEVVVRGTEFRHPEAQSAFKMPISLKDTPQTIKVITQDLLDFAGMHRFEDTYKIDASGGVSHAGDQFPRNYYRGFLQSSINAIKIDGFRMPANIELDLAPFDRFEIVKGATSTLYGQNSISGTLNAVSKAPTDTFGAEFAAEAGRFSHYRGQADLHGPIGDGGAMSYRLIGAYQSSEAFVDYADTRKFVFAPTFRYQFGERTSLTARVIRQENRFMPYFGFGMQFVGSDYSDPAQRVSENFVIPSVPRNRSGGAPWNQAESKATIAHLVAEHAFENGWQLRANAQHGQATDHKNAFVSHLTLQDDSTQFLMYGADKEDEAYGAEVNLFGDVQAFGRTHTLFFGADFADLNSDAFYPLQYAGDFAFSILDPDWSQVPVHRAFTDYADIFQYQDERQMYGLTAQVLLRPADALTLSLSGRYSHDSYRARERYGASGDAYDYQALPFSPDQSLTESAVTGQFGLTYAVSKNVNLYASYGQTFEPRFGRVFTEGGGRLINPEKGRAYEVGLKADAFERRLAYSVALFDVGRTNIAQADPDHPGYSIEIGSQISRGIELEFQGKLMPSWEVYGSVAWLDAEFTRGMNSGLKPANAPDFGISLFTAYQWRSGALKGLGVGGGVVHKYGRETFARLGNVIPFDLGNFTEVDLRVFYDRERWRYEVAATNLLDETYYSTFNSVLSRSLNVNPPRQWLGRVSYRF